MSTDEAEAVAEEGQIERTYVEAHFEDIVSILISTPLGNPLDANCRQGMAGIFWGKSGIGKSDRVKAGAAAVDLLCEDMRPATCQPEDFSGTPWRGKDGELELRCFLQAARRLMTVLDGRGLLFIDEASCATPTVQGAMLGAVLDRRIGDEEFPLGIRVLLAANPPEYAAGGWGLEPPLANRMGHFWIGCPSVIDWGNWLMTEENKKVTPIVQSENRVKENWAVNWADVKGLLYGFMQTSPSLLHVQPEPDHPDSGYNWPSPRTWIMGGRCVATVRSLGLNKELENIMMEGFVGSGAALSWQTWVHEADLPNPRKVLLEGWKHDPSRIDKTVAVYTAVPAYILSLRDRKEQIEMATWCWKRVTDLHKEGQADIVMKVCKTLIQANLGRKSGNEALKKAAEPLLSHFGKSELIKWAGSL